MALIQRIKPNADILLVLETPTKGEVSSCKPMSSAYGGVFKSLMAEHNIDPAQCSVTYAAHEPVKPYRLIEKKNNKVHTYKDLTPYREQLERTIAQANPKLVITAGNLGFHLLTGDYGVNKWRGSQLRYDGLGTECWHMPTLAPEIVMARPEWKYHVKLDLMRASRLGDWDEPEYNFCIAPSYRDVLDRVRFLLHLCEHNPLDLAVDIETRSGHIACCGIAWSNVDALCVPFMSALNPQGYWGPVEEYKIVMALIELFSHPNCHTIFQNGAYDLQYFIRYWFAQFQLYWDTMYTHHVLWAGLPKGLDFLSSMYREFHRYWKDEGKNFDIEHHDEKQLWTYNCVDCVATYEIAQKQKPLITRFGLEEQLDFQLKKNFRTTTRMMVRGVRRDSKKQHDLLYELDNAAKERAKEIAFYAGEEINPKSPKQVQEFFYTTLGQRVVRNRKTGRPSTDDDSISTIRKRCPILTPICNAILDYRSIGVLSSTFVKMATDTDGRIRCSYNIAGTETYRYSSSKNAFGSGGNLQNIPNPEKKQDDNRFIPPNIKKMFIPDEGYELADFDLDRADLQVVVWEAGEDKLKDQLRAGIDLHLANAQVLFQLPYSIEDLMDPEIAERIKKKYSRHRAFAKAFVHGSNYGGSARTMAIAAGCTILEAESAQSIWFSKYEGIKEWHQRIARQLQETRTVTNKFGFRRYYFEPIEKLLPEALAWVPQSTVAIIIDKGINNVDENLRSLDVQPLLQVHDSGVFQYPVANRLECLQKIRKEMEIVVPYDDPLIIPVGAKTSTESWGECKDFNFTECE